MKKIEERTDEKGFRRIWLYETIGGYEYQTYCGLVDKSGKEIVPCKYHNILGFFNGMPLACVELSHKWGYIDSNGKEVVPCEYDFADDRFYCGLATVTKKHKSGAINSRGIEVIPCIYDDVFVFIDNLAGVSRNGKYGSIDTKGDIIIDFKYEYLGVMGQNRICICSYGKYGLIDYKGCLIAPCIYDGLTDFKSGNRIEFKKGAEHGFLDINGNVIQILPF